MPKERFFCEQPLVESDTIHIKDFEFHHLVNVMRAKVDDTLEVVNGMGQLAEAEVQSIEKKQATLCVKNVLTEAAEPRSIILAQAFSRGNRLDFILEKGTELGMTEIWLFPGVLSERKTFSDNQPQRLKNILISAMKQCGRLFLPKIVLMPELAKWDKLKFASFFGDVEKDAPHFLDVINPLKKNESDVDESVIFFIGPESGFTEKEVRKLKDIGVKGVSLSSNILRTDTAALVALALITASH
jgi:16S rRNA (uracil1498-N3)-methyltransferase